MNHKRAFHEVLGRKLTDVSGGMSNFSSARAVELMVVLDVLYQSQMPANAAHKIAEANAGLPEMFESFGHQPGANLAKQVLADLASRVDTD